LRGRPSSQEKPPKNVEEIYSRAKNHPTDPFLLKEDSIICEEEAGNRLPTPEWKPEK